MQERPYRRKQRKYLLYVLISVLVGCVTVFVIFIMVGPMIGSRIFSNIMLNDCTWGEAVPTWLDENTNGKRDAQEPPLQNVTVVFKRRINDGIAYEERVVSDQRGIASFFELMPGCPKVEFEVYPEVPAGFRLTTPSSLFITITISRTYGNENPFLFGFASLPGTLTPTPTSRK